MKKLRLYLFVLSTFFLSINPMNNKLNQLDLLPKKTKKSIIEFVAFEHGNISIKRLMFKLLNLRLINKEWKHLIENEKFLKHLFFEWFQNLENNPEQIFYEVVADANELVKMIEFQIRNSKLKEESQTIESWKKLSHILDSVLRDVPVRPAAQAINTARITVFKRRIRQTAMILIKIYLIILFLEWLSHYFLPKTETSYQTYLIDGLVKDCQGHLKDLPIKQICQCILEHVAIGDRQNICDCTPNEAICREILKQ